MPPKYTQQGYAVSNYSQASSQGYYPPQPQRTSIPSSIIQQQRNPSQQQQLQRAMMQQQQQQTSPQQQRMQQQQRVQQQQRLQRLQQMQQQQKEQQQLQYQQEAQAAATATTDGGAEEQYYYYQIPDGTWGYAPADSTQQFSPVDADGQTAQQPAGYEEPAQEGGGGTGYQVVQADDGNYYYYAPDETPGAGEQTEAQQQQQTAPEQWHQQQQQQQMGYAAAAADLGGVAQPAGSLPADWYEGRPYSLPADRKEVTHWQGTRSWRGELCCVCWAWPCYCLGATLFPWAFACTDRKKMLDKDWSQYVCCAGLCGTNMCRCGTSPQCAMCAESIFCLPCAIHANRAMLMQRYGLKRAACDRAVSAMSHLIFCFICCDKPGWAMNMFDWLYCLAYPCIITQQERERHRILNPKPPSMS